MRVRSFELEPAAIAEFVEVPWQVRGEDPHWVPPIRASIRSELSRENPFFRHGRIRNFMAVRGTAAVGRCSAIIDERLTDDGRPMGMIGYFEVERSYETASALLQDAVDWLASEGMNVVWGPMDFGIFNRYRFKTGGFDLEPFLGEPGNPPVYPRYFERFGFDVLHAYTAWDLDADQVVAVQTSAAEAARRKEVAERGYTYRAFDPTRFDEEVRTLHEMTVACFDAHPGYVPITHEEFAFWYRGMGLFLDPEIALLCEGPAGDVVGASYKYPDWAPLMRELDGELDPRLVEEWRKGDAVDRAVYHTDMVLPEHRRKGVIQGSFARFIDAARARGYVRAATGLARAGNPIWAKVLSVTEPARTYALYRLVLQG